MNRYKMLQFIHKLISYTYKFTIALKPKKSYIALLNCQINIPKSIFKTKKHE